MIHVQLGILMSNWKLCVATLSRWLISECLSRSDSVLWLPAEVFKAHQWRTQQRCNACYRPFNAFALCTRCFLFHMLRQRSLSAQRPRHGHWHFHERIHSQVRSAQMPCCSGWLASSCSKACSTPCGGSNPSLLARSHLKSILVLIEIHEMSSSCKLTTL